MITLLFGENDFELQRRRRKRQADYVTEHGADSVVVRDGESLSAQELPQLLGGVSLFAAEQLIVITQPSAQKATWEALGEWLESGVEADVLLIEAKPDKRTRTYKLLQKHATLEECRPLDEIAAIKWVQAEAAAQQINCSQASARHLVARVGTDQWRLFRALEKLALATQPMSAELIDELIEPYSEANVFELVDAIVGEQHAQTKRLLQLARRSEDPYRFTGLLVHQLYALALVQAAGSSRSPQQIASENSLHPFVVKKNSALARRVAPATLTGLIGRLREADRQSKTTGMDPWRVLEIALLSR